ncbi:MAG TPA: glycosyltransferase family 4 protein [Acidimicrobiales bacterium]
MSPTVTFVAPVPPYGSGIASHSGYLATALDARTDRTVLSWHHQYPQLLFKHTQRSATARPYPGARFLLRWWDPLSWIRAGRIARRSDVLLLTWTTPFHAVHYKVIAWAARAGRRRTAGASAGRPALVAVVHNVEPHEKMPLQRPLTRWVLGSCTGLVAHSTSVAEQLQELIPGVEPVVTTMPTLLEVAPAPLPPTDEIRLLFFGFVRPYKGLDVALDALALLREEGLRPRLRIRGEFWEPVEQFRAQVRARGLEDQVDLQPGYVPDGEVDGLLADCHAVVLPYRSASQSGVVPVAFAAGRPVVASNVGGFVDTVVEGVNGTLAEAGDPRSLADAIRRLVDDLPTLAAGTQKDQPTWDDVAQAVLVAAGVHRGGD